MPTQTFILTRAPECRPISTDKLKRLLWLHRKDTEWEVKEIAAAQLLEEACRAVLPLLQEYRERVMKGEITGNLLAGDYESTQLLKQAIAATEGD